MDFVPIKEYSGTQLPPFTMATIIHYFVTRIACDGKSTNDFKNLEKKSYPLFLDGHVQNITVSSGDKSTIYRANCLPEMKKNVIYNIHLTQNTLSGDIESGTCGCPAGLSCKHIGALCYALEEFHRLGQTKDYTACTSKLQEWNQPRKRILDPQPVTDIKFVKMEPGKLKREPLKHEYDPRPPHLQTTSPEELQSLKDELVCTGRSCGFLYVMPSSPSTSISSSSSSSSTSYLPLVPCSVKERVLVEMKAMDHPLSLIYPPGDKSALNADSSCTWGIDLSLF